MKVDLTDLLARGRLLAICAHPDDLTLGVSAVLSRARNADTVVVTTGARQCDAPTLAATRRSEEIAAMGVLGLEPARLDFFGVTDQEVHCHLDEVIALLERKMARLLPALVLTHDYEQGHPDHDATAFATAIAASRLGIPCYAYPLYHWHAGAVRFCRFREEVPDQEVFRLSNPELAVKFRALACYVSQMNVIKDFSFEYEGLRRLEVRSCDWRTTVETVYEHIPDIAVKPTEVLAEISRWLAAHPEMRC